MHCASYDTNAAPLFNNNNIYRWAVWVARIGTHQIGGLASDDDGLLWRNYRMRVSLENIET